MSKLDLGNLSNYKLSFNKLLVLGFLKLATVAAFAGGITGGSSLDFERQVCGSLAMLDNHLEDDSNLQSPESCFLAGDFRGTVLMTGSLAPKTPGLAENTALAETLEKICKNPNSKLPSSEEAKIREQINTLACQGA